MVKNSDTLTKNEIQIRVLFNNFDIFIMKNGVSDTS